MLTHNYQIIKELLLKD